MMNKELNRNDLCWCKSGLKYKMCHSYIDEQIKFYKQKGCIVPSRKLLKSKSQIEGIKRSGEVNIAVLDYISEKIQIGMSTEDIDRLIYNKTKELGGIPAPLGFENYPKSVCTSINDVICHGIPSEEIILQEGDIINIDVSTIYNGYYSDSSRMFCLGKVSAEKKHLVEVAKKSIEVGLKEVKAWNFLGDVGQAIHDFAKSYGYSVVKEIGGHGIGLEFHEEPFVSYVSRKGTSMLLVPGMVFTIEPMINMGKPDVKMDPKNGWTIYTADGKDSAQWEVTVLVTDSGYEILAY
jgi:methionyl aminopeptidase